MRACKGWRTMIDDRISSIITPQLLERFDSIPYEHKVNVTLEKGELALLLRSYIGLHQSLAQILSTAIAFSQSPEATQSLLQAFQKADASFKDFAHVADR